MLSVAKMLFNMPSRDQKAFFCTFLNIDAGTYHVPFLVKDNMMIKRPAPFADDLATQLKMSGNAQVFGNNAICVRD